MDYLRCLASISRIDRIRNEIMKTEMGMNEDILQEIEEQIRQYGHLVGMEDCRIARQVAE
jgi:hypothetical protein